MTPRYYIQVGEQNEGPFTLAELLGRHYDGLVGDDTQVRDAESDAWYPFSKIKMLYQAMILSGTAF